MVLVIVMVWGLKEMSLKLFHCIRGVVPLHEVAGGTAFPEAPLTIGVVGILGSF
jgi:hypothetical protein